jgi:predicted RNA-binding protein with PUA-like domain
MATRHWLFKSDPETFGIDDLARVAGRRTRWDGIRNYQARNLLRDEVRSGDRVLFYHSQAHPPAIVGTARVVAAGYPDPTQFDPSCPGHDPAASQERPRWYAVDIRLEKKLPRIVTLPQVRATPGLGRMVLLRRSRLSVQPVTPAEWRIILKLAEAPRGRRSGRDASGA